MDNQDDKVTAAYDKLVKDALAVGFTEQQLLFILGKIVEIVSPSLVDLQEQINTLKTCVETNKKDNLKNKLEELQKNA
jgi:hypothetical protein